MCGECFVCIYLVCQRDGLELVTRNRRISVRGVAVRIQPPARRHVGAVGRNFGLAVVQTKFFAFFGGGRVCDVW